MLGSGPGADRGRQGCGAPGPLLMPWVPGARASFLASTACTPRALGASLVHWGRPACTGGVPRAALRACEPCASETGQGERAPDQNQAF